MEKIADQSIERKIRRDRIYAAHGLLPATNLSKHLAAAELSEPIRIVPSDNFQLWLQQANNILYWLERDRLNQLETPLTDTQREVLYQKLSGLERLG